MKRGRDSVKVQVRERQGDGIDVMESLIARYGWAIKGNPAADDGSMPVYAYTVGLGRMGLSELMVVGMPHPMCGGLLNELAIQQVSAFKAGEHTMPGPVVIDCVERKLYLVAVGRDEAAKYAPEVLERESSAAWPVLQLCWADLEGVFPWEPNYESCRIDQPVLGVAPGLAH